MGSAFFLAGATFRLINSYAGMSNSEAKTSRSMIKFVLTIFIIAILVALTYLLFYTPGEPTPVAQSVNEVAR